VDDVFKALADPTRRRLLDTLRDRGGLTLTELEQGLGMTRFGVMKHLKVLEDANLIVTRRDGRFKHHYLNALPIQEVADRWMAPYGKPLARFALNIKNALEAPMADKPDFVFATYIRTTPAKLWDALTNPEMTRQYYYNSRVITDLKVGGKFAYEGPDGQINLDGEILEIVPLKKLVTTFKATWAPDGEPTRIEFEIEPAGEACKLTMTHYDYEKSKAGVEMGWPMIVAGLKTLLETGKPLNLPDM
jgi:uncharacterized protein YndB with AHSA1/START domain/DNA-binding transcriptional ArsR family regulator